jgi:hypothetical protein
MAAAPSPSKLELRGQVRSQAGAWERGDNEGKVNNHEGLHIMSAKKWKQLLIVLPIVGFLCWAQGVATRGYHIFHETRAIDAIISSDPDFSHVTHYYVPAVHGSRIDGYVDSHGIMDRLNGKLDQAGVSPNYRNVVIQNAGTQPDQAEKIKTEK